ncbi:MAG TPA: glycosyltransferase [Mucilaginibacter sp.]|jgi:hypothetical protein|nr:glycosyltransferase [Mucilaginibacter sp.]
MKIKRSKISFCIVCKNSLHELKHTLRQNITDSENYDGVDFIIVDHNSTDGTDYWIKETFEYINTGIIKYYKIAEPRIGYAGLLKNIAFKLSEADIICDLNPHEYIGPDFACYINEVFEFNKGAVFISSVTGTHVSSTKTYAKLCLSKKHFLLLKGFDEYINKACAVIADIINRLQLLHLKHELITNTQYQRHYLADTETINFDEKVTVHKLFINYQSSSVSGIIVLYTDNLYIKGTLVNKATVDSENHIYAYKKRETSFRYDIKEPGWETGTWKLTQNESIHFTPVYGDEYIFIQSYNQYSTLKDISNNIIYYNIMNPEVINDIAIFNAMFYSQLIMSNNLKREYKERNNFEFGKAIVSKNFKWELPITI